MQKLICSHAAANQAKLDWQVSRKLFTMGKHDTNSKQNLVYHDSKII